MICGFHIRHKYVTPDNTCQRPQLLEQCELSLELGWHDLAEQFGFKQVTRWSLQNGSQLYGLASLSRHWGFDDCRNSSNAFLIQLHEQFSSPVQLRCEASLFRLSKHSSSMLVHKRTWIGFGLVCIHSRQQ
eukprot:TRINITY_DN11080_c0_g2_i4.p1 TRINITY_DN11080_c0_g2~~TRINITY_DN11080_c0_g2_i4.p1  ORF type:complete len:131 (-),score=2.05 TRINITY_DN11080_c0_g2_i4:211-603(-)